MQLCQCAKLRPLCDDVLPASRTDALCKFVANRRGKVWPSGAPCFGSVAVHETLLVVFERVIVVVPGYVADMTTWTGRWRSSRPESLPTTVS